MKCLYKSASEQKARIEICEQLGDMWLKFVEAVAAVELHDIYGWNAEQIKKVQDDTNDLLDELMYLYSTQGEDIWETTLTANYGIRHRLEGLGFNLEKITNQMPVIDRFHDSWHSAADIERHEFRAQWISTMEKKLIVYWGVICLWLNEGYGFEADQLERLYTAARITYNKFAELWLMCKKERDRKMSQLFEDEVLRAAEIKGETLEKPKYTIDEFIASMKSLSEREGI